MASQSVTHCVRELTPLQERGSVRSTSTLLVLPPEEASISCTAPNQLTLVSSRHTRWGVCKVLANEPSSNLPRPDKNEPKRLFISLYTSILCTPCVCPAWCRAHLCKLYKNYENANFRQISKSLCVLFFPEGSPC